MNQEAATTTLGLNDLRLMAQIIKVVSSRGAIQAEEMLPVGALYNKLVEFVKSADDAAAAESPEAVAEAAEAIAEAVQEAVNG